MERKQMRMNDNNTSDGGISILGCLQIIFIVLKCVGVISWSWVIVFIPTFISIGISAIALIIYMALVAGINKNSNTRK